MSVYIYGLICASLALGMFEILIPENAKTRSYIRLIFGLVMVLAVIRPISGLNSAVGDILHDLNGDEFDGSRYEEMSEQQLSEAYKKGVTAALEEEFGLESFEVGVLLGEDGKPERISVTLMKGDIFRNPYRIEEYVFELFGCECITVIG